MATSVCDIERARSIALRMSNKHIFQFRSVPFIDIFVHRRKANLLNKAMEKSLPQRVLSIITLALSL